VDISQVRHRLTLPSKAAYQMTRRPLYSFVQSPPSLERISQARPMLGAHFDETDRAFETSLARIIGAGEAVSYASGRMAFFSLMKTLGIGWGDEVILPGFTCSVMVNAILRVGATPIFSDIEASTFGSDPKSVQNLLTAKTRMIVAQHSFGYPCDIEAIMHTAKQAGVFVLEDCATSLGTKIGERTIGDFGHAAIFSTDHAKPINTLIGGMLYTQDRELLAILRSDHLGLEDLPMAKQQSVWKQMRLEALYQRPRNQWKLGARNALASPFLRISRAPSPFLSEDYLPTTETGTYPYPSRLPSFLAFVGLEQTEKWYEIERQRMVALQLLLRVVKASPSGAHLPQVLKDREDSIVPLRLAWADPNSVSIKRRIKRFITTEGTWFIDPIVATSAPAEEFGYRWGSCPVAESQGPRMINIPIPNSMAEVVLLSRLLARALSV
jgi:perosamine synthetase